LPQEYFPPDTRVFAERTYEDDFLHVELLFDLECKKMWSFDSKCPYSRAREKYKKFKYHLHVHHTQQKKRRNDHLVRTECEYGNLPWLHATLACSLIRPTPQKLTI